MLTLGRRPYGVACGAAPELPAGADHRSNRCLFVGASPGAGLLTAFHRVVEITLGCIIGTLTAHLVLPDRARVAIKTGAAGVLDGLGEVAERI